jgi:hypothetical protein
MKLSIFLGFAGIAALAAGCSSGSIGDAANPGANPSNGAGPSGGAGSPGGGGGGGPSGGAGSPGGGGTSTPFEAATAQASTRKVKNLLTGLPPTDADIGSVTAMGADGLKTLIDGWMAQPEFRDKMLFFFRNSFQQTGFIATEDFKPQLLTNGGFDFQTTPGDDIFLRLQQNLEDSFALTAWQTVTEGRPFSEVLTTRRFMMTTALKATYLQIEMPRDTRGAAAPTISWKVDESGVDIPIEQIVDPASPNYLTFADVAPTANARIPTLACRGTAGMINPFTGFNTLFQVLLGAIPQYSAIDPVTMMNTTVCDRHSSRPYFTVQDTNDWQWVTVRPLAAGETRLMPYNIPALRTATELGLALPRVGFYTTPAFLALWNTNDSNQHRVTANQTLLVALGESFTSADGIVPLSAAGLDAAHTTTTGECYGCHKSLDPMRQFWATQYDFNDRNDFIARAGNGVAANPRPTTTGGGFAFGSVNTTGTNMFDFGPLLGQVADVTDAAQPINRFAMATTQKLCFFANSSACNETDPEFRRIARAFETGNFNFSGLVRDLFSSPLVTGASKTVTADTTGVTISISRRDQLCTSLSNRLGKPDLCALMVPLPSATQAATAKIATSVPADAFSRGSEIPITASDPTLFYSSATEILCENIAPLVVDATAATVWSSTAVPAAIADMVERLMGYPPSDPLHAGAVQILQDNYNQHMAVRGTTATNALRSTFALACESPTSLSFGL